MKEVFDINVIVHHVHFVHHVHVHPVNVHLAQEEGYITPEGLDLLKRFKEDQENWQNA